MDKTDNGLGWDGIGIDPLTGLHNRSYLEALEMAFSGRTGSWSLIMLDVDHFKLINDIYGHLEGDKVLRQTALNIQMNLKKTDTAMRFGGDEFLLVLPDTGRDGALNLAERLMYEVERCNYPSGVRVSLSMGVSQSRESDLSLNDMISRADKALYRAKEGGRGRFYFFTEEALETESPDINFLHMVGRRQELQKLRQLLDETVTDSSRFALVTGEAGVGKSRLVEEMLNYCDFMKVMVVRHACADYQRHQPYDLVAQPLRQALDLLSERELEVVRRKMGPVHPATVELFPELNASVLDDTLYFREERLRFRIFQDVALLISAVSAMRPLALILDNLQWISEPDLGILSFVARNTPEAHVFYLCMMRMDDSVDGNLENLLSIRSSIPLLHLELEKLTLQESRNMILFALKDPNVPGPLQDFLVNQSGGNPLFLRELVSSLVSDGHISSSRSGEKVYKLPEDMDIPESLSQIITARLRNIDAGARDVLRVASLSPEHLTLSLLESVVGGDPILLARRLDSCIKAGLLEEMKEGRNEIGFVFTHGAVREFLSRELPDSLKLTYHRRMAAYFEEFYMAGKDDLLTTVAYHFTRSKDERKAAKFSLTAARQAFSRGANRDAIAWFNEFLDRIDSTNVEPRSLFHVHMNLGMIYAITADTAKADEHLNRALELAEGPEEEAAVQFKLGKSYHQKSMYPEAMQCFERAVALCTESGSDDPMVIGTSVESRIAASFIRRVKGDYDGALESLDGARELLDRLGEKTRDDLRACYLTRRADVLSETGDSNEALDLYKTALDICRRIGDLPGEALVLNNMHGRFSSSGDFGRAMQTLDEVLRLNRRLDDHLGVAIAYYNIAEHNLQLNMLQHAREYYGKYLELNDQIGNILGMGFGHFGLGFLNFLEGNLEASEECLREAIEIFQRLECEETLASCRLRLATILIRTGRSAEAAELVALVSGDHRTAYTHSELSYVRGLLEMSGDDPGLDRLEAAAASFRESIELPESQDPPGIALRVTALAKALQLLGREDEERAALEEGASLMSRELQRISPLSARNSILTRSEIVEFRSMLKSRGIAFDTAQRPAGH